jgi:hypothetical protein
LVALLVASLFAVRASADERDDLTQTRGDGSRQTGDIFLRSLSDDRQDVELQDEDPALILTVSNWLLLLGTALSCFALGCASNEVCRVKIRVSGEAQTAASSEKHVVADSIGNSKELCFDSIDATSEGNEVPASPRCSAAKEEIFEQTIDAFAVAEDVRVNEVPVLQPHVSRQMKLPGSNSSSIKTLDISEACPVGDTPEPPMGLPSAVTNHFTPRQARRSKQQRRFEMPEPVPWHSLPPRAKVLEVSAPEKPNEMEVEVWEQAVNDTHEIATELRCTIRV